MRWRSLQEPGEAARAAGKRAGARSARRRTGSRVTLDEADGTLVGALPSS
jgi:hypothetical protein